MLGCDGSRYQERFPGRTYTFVPGDDYEGGDFVDFERDIPEEIRHCQWEEHTYTSTHLGGEYTLCQSKNSKSDIFVKLKNAENDDTGNPLEVCFFPTYVFEGKTTLLGERRCRRIESETIYRIVFSKPSSEDSSINSIMVVKNKLYRYARPFPYYGIKGPDAFENCMGQLKMGDDKYCQSFHEKEEYLSHTF